MLIFYTARMLTRRCNLDFKQKLNHKKPKIFRFFDVMEACLLAVDATAAAAATAIGFTAAATAAAGTFGCEWFIVGVNIALLICRSGGWQNLSVPYNRCAVVLPGIVLGVDFDVDLCVCRF